MLFITIIKHFIKNFLLSYPDNHLVRAVTMLIIAIYLFICTGLEDVFVITGCYYFSLLFFNLLIWVSSLLLIIHLVHSLCQKLSHYKSTEGVGFSWSLIKPKLIFFKFKKKSQDIVPSSPSILYFFTFIAVMSFWGLTRLNYVLNSWVYTTNHKRIAINYFNFVLVSGTAGMSLATVIRLEFAYPGIGILVGDSLQYLSIATAHGVIMVFFMIMPAIFGGFGNFLLPTQLGVHDVAFPRLNSAAFWFLPGGLIMLCQLICIDRRYQRLNCFNMRQLETILRRQFYTDFLSIGDHRSLMTNSMIGLRFKLNHHHNFQPDQFTFYNFGLKNSDKITPIALKSSINIWELDPRNYVLSLVKDFYNYYVSSLNFYLDNIPNTNVLNKNLTLNTNDLFYIPSWFDLYTLPLLNNFGLYNQSNLKVTNSVSSSNEIYDYNFVTSHSLQIMPKSGLDISDMADSTNTGRFIRFTNPMVEYEYRKGTYFTVWADRFPNLMTSIIELGRNDYFSQWFQNKTFKDLFSEDWKYFTNNFTNNFDKDFIVSDVWYSSHVRPTTNILNVFYSLQKQNIYFTPTLWEGFVRRWSKNRGVLKTSNKFKDNTPFLINDFVGAGRRTLHMPFFYRTKKKDYSFTQGLLVNETKDLGSMNLVQPLISPTATIFKKKFVEIFRAHDIKLYKTNNLSVGLSQLKMWFTKQIDFSLILKDMNAQRELSNVGSLFTKMTSEIILPNSYNIGVSYSHLFQPKIQVIRQLDFILLFKDLNFQRELNNMGLLLISKHLELPKMTLQTIPFKLLKMTHQTISFRFYNINDLSSYLFQPKMQFSRQLDFSLLKKYANHQYELSNIGPLFTNKYSELPQMIPQIISHDSFQFRWSSNPVLSQKYYRLFTTDSTQQRIVANWRELKFTREAWRCKLLVSRHQTALFRRFTNEDNLFWAIERNAKDLLPGWAMITPFSARTRYTAVGKTDIGLVAVFIVLNSSIISSANFLITYRYLSTLNNRKMRDARSFFTEGLITASWMMIAANPMLMIGIIMLLSDRHWQTSFFDYSGGGDAILFQHMFWFFGHPEVYVIMLPVFGYVNTILSFFLRKRISARGSLLYSMYTIAFLGFFVWGHHMYMVGLSHTTRMLFSTLTVMISVPAATKLMHWSVTVVNSFFTLELPLLFTLTFIFFFVSGGVSGMYVANTGMDVLFHDTFYVIGHFHVMFAGSAMIGIFAAFYFYFPALYGVKYSRVYGYIHYTYYIIGQLMTVIPMLWLGYCGQPRRVLDYPSAFGSWHSISSAGHLLSVAAMLSFFIMIYDSIRQSKPAVRNTFGVGRFNTRLNFYFFEIHRLKFTQQKNFIYKRSNHYASLNVEYPIWTGKSYTRETLQDKRSIPTFVTTNININTLLLRSFETSNISYIWTNKPRLKHLKK